MKSIIFTLALMLPIAVNAQRVRYVCNDDVYSTRYVSGYDKVIDENTSVKNVIVNHNKVINYYHKNNVVEHHYTIGDCPNQCTDVRRYTISGHCYHDSYAPYCYEYYDECYYDKPNCNIRKNWCFFFEFNSTYIINEREIGHLVGFAKSHPYAVFYFDAYSDIATGSGKVNRMLSRDRAYTIINILLNKGISRKRMFIVNHGSETQPYSINEYNRCVIVSTTN